MGSIPGSGRSSGEGYGNPIQYPCLENPMDKRSLAGYSPWGRKESDTIEQLHILSHRSLVRKMCSICVCKEGIVYCSFQSLLTFIILLDHEVGERGEVVSSLPPWCQGWDIQRAK